MARPPCREGCDGCIDDLRGPSGRDGGSVAARARGPLREERRDVRHLSVYKSVARDPAEGSPAKDPAKGFATADPHWEGRKRGRGGSASRRLGAKEKRETEGRTTEDRRMSARRRRADRRRDSTLRRRRRRTRPGGGVPQRARSATEGQSARRREVPGGLEGPEARGARRREVPRRARGAAEGESVAEEDESTAPQDGREGAAPADGQVDDGREGGRPAGRPPFVCRAEARGVPGPPDGVHPADAAASPDSQGPLCPALAHKVPSLVRSGRPHKSRTLSLLASLPQRPSRRS
jgi:hypothetical protein